MGWPMPSNTSITESRRRRKSAKAGKENKKRRTKEGTPKFPIHPEQPTKG
jgi:hypothetical protein